MTEINEPGGEQDDLLSGDDGDDEPLLSGSLSDDDGSDDGDEPLLKAPGTVSQRRRPGNAGGSGLAAGAGAAAVAGSSARAGAVAQSARAGRPAARISAEHLVNGIGLLHDVPLEITVEIGRRRMTVGDILALGPSSVVELDKPAGDPLDLLVNGVLVARGEAVVVNERFGIRLTSLVEAEDGAAPSSMHWAETPR
jgi:flagellar motor switch protein FliN/FliY